MAGMQCNLGRWDVLCESVWRERKRGGGVVDGKNCRSVWASAFFFCLERKTTAQCSTDKVISFTFEGKNLALQRHLPLPFNQYFGQKNGFRMFSFLLPVSFSCVYFSHPLPSCYCCLCCLHSVNAVFVFSDFFGPARFLPRLFHNLFLIALQCVFCFLFAKCPFKELVCSMCCVKCESWGKTGGGHAWLLQLLSCPKLTGWAEETHTHWSCMLLVSWCVRDGAVGRGEDQLGLLRYIYIFAFLDTIFAFAETCAVF